MAKHMRRFARFGTTCKKHTWRSVTFSKDWNFTKSNTHTWVFSRSHCSLQLYWKNTSPWVFFTFFKLYKWYQIAQSITIIKILQQILLGLCYMLNHFVNSGRYRVQTPSQWTSHFHSPANIYLSKVNTSLCIFISNFEHISHLRLWYFTLKR